MTKLYTSLLLSFLCLSVQAQHQIINPTIDPQVKIDSAEVSVEKYLEAFDRKLHAESPEVLELINDKTILLTKDDVINKIKILIKHILCGLQDTKYPITFKEINSVKKF